MVRVVSDLWRIFAASTKRLCPNGHDITRPHLLLVQLDLIDQLDQIETCYECGGELLSAPRAG